MATRKGKHKEDKVSIGIYADLDFKALLAYVVDLSGETATDILMDGVRAKATSLGIMKDGVIKPEHKIAIEVIKDVLMTKKGKTNARTGK